MRKKAEFVVVIPNDDNTLSEYSVSFQLPYLIDDCVIEDFKALLADIYAVEYKDVYTLNEWLAVRKAMDEFP